PRLLLDAALVVARHVVLRRQPLADSAGPLARVVEAVAHRLLRMAESLAGALAQGLGLRRHRLARMARPRRHPLAGHRGLLAHDALRVLGLVRERLLLRGHRLLRVREAALVAAALDAAHPDRVAGAEVGAEVRVGAGVEPRVEAP